MSTDSPTASAFAPGHVTAFFSPVRAETVYKTGAIGGGVTLTDGVTATVRPASERTVKSADISDPVPAVEHVLKTFDTPMHVHLETPLPVGAGFGVSGAAALATALAANEIHHKNGGTPVTENELVRLAHAADVRAETGLGDVVAQARGGVPLRLDPGAPPHGRLDGIPASGRIEYLTFGEMSTASVLRGDTEAIEAAGRSALAAVRDRPTLDRLLSAARTFATETGLLTEEVRSVLEATDAMTDGNATAAMVMLGQSVFAVDDGLTAAGYDPAVCRIQRPGAGVTSGP